MPMLTPVSEHELLLFWLQLVVLLAAARGLGHVARVLGQPRVVGELAAGVLLGPTVLGRLLPDLSAALFPGDRVQSALLLGVAWLGIALLLVVTGFETDLPLLRRLGRPLVGLSLGSLLVPLAVGLAVGWVMPATLRGPAADRLTFAVFVAIALSVTALPVVAKILTDMGLMRRSFAQLTVAAGTVNDIVGWMLLGVAVGLISEGGADARALGVRAAAVVLFVVLALTVGQRLADLLLRRARESGGYAGALTSTLLVTFGLGAITQAMGVEAVLGALIAGVVLGRSRYQRPDVRRTVEVLSTAVFAPVFFATAGLYVDLAALLEPTTAFWTVVVLGAATVSKLGGSVVGGRLAGMRPVESLAAGLGLNVRGAMGIVLAAVGLALGALNAASYAIIVVLAVLTSMAAPPTLRAVLRRLRAAPEEDARLAREELLAGSVLAGATTALLPTRGGLNSAVAARVLDGLLPPEAGVGVLSVRAPRAEAADLEDVRRTLGARRHEVRHVEDTDPAGRILREARLGVGVVTLGINDDYRGSHRLSEPIQRVIAACPVPLLLVRRGERVRDAADLDGRALRRVLVGVTGTVAGRAAEEVAFGLANRLDGRVRAVHVLQRSGERDGSATGAAVGAGEEPDGPGARQLARVRTAATAFGVRDLTVAVAEGPAAADELGRAAEAWQADVVVVGTVLRAVDDRPFLGHGTEWLLENARQTVVVVALPAVGANE